MTIKQVQEWLCIYGHNIKIDGQFGPVTQSACEDFCRKHDMKFSSATGIVFLNKLKEPIDKVNKKVSGSNVKDVLVKIAEQHFAQKPREIGGNNCGPWVRLYTGGNEGKAYPWCAFFATYCIDQAKKQGAMSWLGRDGSSTSIYKKAKKLGKVLMCPEPGCLFLVKNTTGVPWKSHIHTGIVASIGDGFVNTIEGNTNAGGSVNGDGVYVRRRSFKDLDFIQID
jgi:hypothetical protein